MHLRDGQEGSLLPGIRIEDMVHYTTSHTYAAAIVHTYTHHNRHTHLHFCTSQLTHSVVVGRGQFFP